MACSSPSSRTPSTSAQAGDTGDHLHFDMCLDPFTWHEFKTAGKRWIDPVPVLEAHLQPQVVQEMLKKD